jgi:hypothetical protein
LPCCFAEASSTLLAIKKSLLGELFAASSFLAFFFFFSFFPFPCSISALVLGPPPIGISADMALNCAHRLAPGRGRNGEVSYAQDSILTECTL